MKLRVPRFAFKSSARTALFAVGAAGLAAGAVTALLSASAATQPRYYDVATPTAHSLASTQGPSPWLVSSAENATPGACQIAASVVDDGSARSGVELHLARVTADGSVEQWRAVSDSKGVHRFLDLPAGTYQLTALSDDRAPSGSPELHCTGHNERAFFTLALAKADHVFTGKVTSRDGKLAPGAEIAIAQDIDARTHLAGPARVPVATDGTFSVRLAPGKYILLAQAPNHASMLRKVTFDEGAQKTNGKFALIPAPHVVGRVVDENGNPLAGALVAAGGVLDPKQRVPTVKTEADGTFSLPVADGQDVVLTAHGAGLVARSSLGVAQSAFGFSGVELVARAGRAVEGFVSKPDGSAWAFGEVRYRVRDLGLSGTEKADADGHFVVDGMPNDADVEVWAEGNATGAWGAQVASPGNDKLALVYTPPAY